ncbi:MAG: polyprenol monophosphomannose synthase [Chloroflexota bacterium]
MRCLVVVPTYNERDNLGELVTRTLEQGEMLDVLVVDDNSPDGTGELADELASRLSRVKVLHRAGRMGLGTAYVAGFRYGLAEGYDFLFEMDADFSHDPAYLTRFLHKVEEGYDVVVGSRNIAGGGVRNWPLTRRLLSRGGSLYAGLILGLDVTDATGGYKCFKRQVLESLDLDSIRSNGYSFQIEVNYRCQQLGFRIGEVPIIFVDRTRGGSKMSRRIVLEAMGMVWRLRLERLLGRGAAAMPRGGVDREVARLNRS